jgi:hypothetical protein
VWRALAAQSPTTRRRWQGTWVFDATVCKKYCAKLGLVGRWWSGQHKSVGLGIDGLLVLGVIGDGNWCCI